MGHRHPLDQPAGPGAERGRQTLQGRRVPLPIGCTSMTPSCCKALGGKRALWGKWRECSGELPCVLPHTADAAALLHVCFEMNESNLQVHCQPHNGPLADLPVIDILPDT